MVTIKIPDRTKPVVTPATEALVREILERAGADGTFELAYTMAASAPVEGGVEVAGCQAKFSIIELRLQAAPSDPARKFNLVLPQGLAPQLFFGRLKDAAEKVIAMREAARAVEKNAAAVTASPEAPRPSSSLRHFSEDPTSVALILSELRKHADAKGVVPRKTCTAVVMKMSGAAKFSVVGPFLSAFKRRNFLTQVGNRHHPLGYQLTRGAFIFLHRQLGEELPPHLAATQPSVAPPVPVAPCAADAPLAPAEAPPQAEPELPPSTLNGLKRDLLALEGQVRPFFEARGRLEQIEKEMRVFAEERERLNRVLGDPATVAAIAKLEQIRRILRGGAN